MSSNRPESTAYSGLNLTLESNIAASIAHNLAAAGVAEAELRGLTSASVQAASMAIVECMNNVEANATSAIVRTAEQNAQSMLVIGPGYNVDYSRGRAQVLAEKLDTRDKKDGLPKISAGSRKKGKSKK